MTNDEQRSGDAGWIAQIRESWSRPPLTPNQRAAFDERLDERLRVARRADWLLPVGVFATAAILGAVVLKSALLPGASTESVELFLASAGSPETTEADLPDEFLTERDLAEAWIEFGDEAYASEESGAMDASDLSLPDDYAAIESLLLGG
ncbi:MAG: hypothetical protein VX246_07920 [Myxococcota bacterium]|nr:hypothetical protein [Myxococcota bacterium]